MAVFFAIGAVGHAGYIQVVVAVDKCGCLEKFAVGCTHHFTIEEAGSLALYSHGLRIDNGCHHRRNALAAAAARLGKIEVEQFVV